MASGKNARSVLTKISKHHLECSVCFDRFKEPKLLDCFHSFCLECLKQLAESQSPVSPAGTKLPCPICRRETILQHEVTDLPSNFTLSALVEEFAIQEQLLEGQGSEIKYKQDVTKLIESAEEKLKNMRHAKVTLDKRWNILDIMFADTNTKISLKADKEVARIRDREQKLKNEAQEIYEDRVVTFKIAEYTISKELAEAGQMLNEVNQVVAQEIQSEIVYLEPKLLQNLKELTEKQFNDVPDMLHYLDFQDGDEKLLGSLVLEDKWELTQRKIIKSESTGPRCSIDSIAVFSNNEIVTVDRSLKQLMSYPPTTSKFSTAISQKLEIQDLTNPRRVAVNKDDQLIVLDASAVKIFSREYKLLHQFTPGEDSDGTPTCLAVDDNNLIAVGYRNEEQITLHDPDGSLILHLPAPMIEDQLVISMRRFIYINSMKGKMVSVDYNSDTVFIVDTVDDTNIKAKPISLCSDGHGNMYTYMECRFLYLPVSQIGHFGPDGKYIGCVQKSAYINQSGVIYTQAGDLVLATPTAIETYKHV